MKPYRNQEHNFPPPHKSPPEPVRSLPSPPPPPPPAHVAISLLCIGRLVYIFEKKTQVPSRRRGVSHICIFDTGACRGVTQVCKSTDARARLDGLQTGCGEEGMAGGMSREA